MSAPYRVQPLTSVIMLTLTAFVLTSCVPLFRTAPPTSADYCDIDPALLDQPPTYPIVIEVWASAPRQQCLRAYALWLAAQQHPELGLSVKVRANNINAAPYRDELLTAAAQGKAPDISFLYHYHLPALLQGGHLYSLEECRQQPTLREIPDELWTTMSPDGKAWGVPFEIEPFLLYYNKAMLRELGWSKAAIEELPTQIASGNFDLYDLLKVAEAAVEGGITQPGLAFVPHQTGGIPMDDLYRAFGGRSFDRQKGQFLINQQTLQQTFAFLAALHRHNLLDTNFAMRNFNTWGNNVVVRDAVAHGRVLFWHGYASDWQQMMMDYMPNTADKGELQERIGVALLPVGDQKQAGKMLGVDLNLFVIFNEKASGRNNQAAACRLLAALHTTNVAQRHADEASQLTVRASQIIMPAYWQDIGLQQIIWVPDHLPVSYSLYVRTLAEMGANVEGGSMSVEEAVRNTIEQLQEQLGDQLVVE